MNIAQIRESYQIRKERSGSFPENFEREPITDPTASELEPHKCFTRSSTVKIPMWVFSASGMAIKASKPVSVKVLRGETLFFVENENLDIYANGKSLEEAMRAFNDHLIYFYNHYKSLSWNRVTGEAKRLKKLYGELFQVTSI